jgi:hypothetical protein
MYRMEHRTSAYMSPRPLVSVDNEFVSCLKVVPLNKLTWLNKMQFINICSIMKVLRITVNCSA